MIHLTQRKEAQELYDEAERSVLIAMSILATAMRYKAAAVLFTASLVIYAEITALLGKDRDVLR